MAALRPALAKCEDDDDWETDPNFIVTDNFIYLLSLKFIE